MAVRQSYTLRTPLDESILDTPIDLSFSNGIQFKRQITIRTLCVTVLAVLGLYVCFSIKPLTHSGILGACLFILGYAWFIGLMITPTPTHLEGYQEFIPAWHYSLDDEYRKVMTRSISPSKPVSKLLGIKDITADNGKRSNNSLIAFNNGDLGEILELVGNASILTFSSDRRDILNATNVFYRRLKPNISLTFDSVSSAQRVVDQLHAKDWQFQNMYVQDPHLRNLVMYQRDILKNFVGKRFKAWHQYLIVRGKSRETINTFNSWIASCTQRDGLFVSKYRKLNTKEMKRYLKNLYGDDVTA